MSKMNNHSAIQNDAQSHMSIVCAHANLQEVDGRQERQADQQYPQEHEGRSLRQVFSPGKTQHVYVQHVFVRT